MYSFNFEKIIIQSRAQAIILQLENDFPDDEEEQARHAREYTVEYFGKDNLRFHCTAGG